LTSVFSHDLVPMAISAAQSDRIVNAIVGRVQHIDADLREHPPVPFPRNGDAHLADSVLVTHNDNLAPVEIFDRLRWGGHVLYVTPSRHDAVRFGIQLSNFGFEVTQKPAHVSMGLWGLPIPYFSTKMFYFVARKVQLVHPGEATERFTFHVHLHRPDPAGPYVVVKEVPTIDMVMARLRSKWPDLADDILEKRARKFTDKIFPIFLTREAAILKIVQRDLSEQYRMRVPRLLHMEQDERGFVQKMHLSWLRNGGAPLSQLEFAHQSADLLRALHDEVGVMHLDLRLDNFVITPDGVGFVDFGSAVRNDENLKQNPLLAGLFEELMRTSEIQRMLFSMTRTGQVTSEAISCGLHKVDKAVDYFYLAVQISAPHSNPDLKDLIEYRGTSDEARFLSELTQQILRPPDPAHPIFRSAADILHGIERIRDRLTRAPLAASISADS
jgi:hypothetical protein